MYFILQKNVDGKTLYFYPGLGYISKENIIEVEMKKEFLYNPDNIMNCEECPENGHFSAWPENRLPCGQFHCWVSLHCDK